MVETSAAVLEAATAASRANRVGKIDSQGSWRNAKILVADSGGGFAAEDSRHYSFDTCEHSRPWSSAIRRRSYSSVTFPDSPARTLKPPASLEELRENLREVVSMLLEDGEPKLETEFVGTEAIEV